MYSCDWIKDSVCQKKKKHNFLQNKVYIEYGLQDNTLPKYQLQVLCVKLSFQKNIACKKDVANASAEGANWFFFGHNHLPMNC